MIGTSRKRQNRKQIFITQVQNYAPAATTSNSAIYTSPAPYMATDVTRHSAVFLILSTKRNVDGMATQHVYVLDVKLVR